MKKPGGFSLNELLIVLGVAVTVALLGSNILSTVQTHTALRSTTGAVIESLRNSRERSLAAINDSQYGVHLQADRYVIFAGTTYNPVAASNESFGLDQALEIVNINLTGGGTDVVFQKVTGATTTAGSFQIRLKNSADTLETVQILPSGQVQLGAVAQVTSARLTDSRHTHFDLGWSILGASTLTLVFHEPGLPDVSYDIGMAPYFTNSPDAFVWEGTLIAYSQPQVLSLHTHSLDAFDTSLSVHRDQRYNTKAVTISIDGKEIGSYDAAGNATVGLFGGTMAIQ